MGGLLSPEDAAQGSDVALSLKDLALLLASRSLPIAECIHGLFDRAARSGLADRDPTAVKHLSMPRR